MSTQNSEVNYREITVPGGTFRMYDDSPNEWVQVSRPGEKNVIQKIADAFEAGEINKSNK